MDSDTPERTEARSTVEITEETSDPSTPEMSIASISVAIPKPTLSNRQAQSRPSKTMMARAIAMLIEGYSAMEVARALDLPRRAISRWKEDYPEFTEMLERVDDEAAKIVLDEVRKTVREEIIELGPRAVQVMSAALEHADTRVALQAAALIMRNGGGPGEHVSIGLEGMLARASASPGSGD